MPVVSTDSEGPVRNLARWIDGILVSRGNVELLVQALGGLIADPDAPSAWGERLLVCRETYDMLGSVPDSTRGAWSCRACRC